MDPTFEHILRGAQLGDEGAWAIVHGMLFDQLVGYLRSQGSRDPENGAADVFMRVAEGIGGFEGGEAGFRSWVFTIAHNLLIDERRARSRRPEVLEEATRDEVALEDVESSALSNLGTQWVMRHLSQLSDEQREVLALRILGGFTIGQIGEIVGKRPNAVKALQRRGLKQIEKRIAGDPYPSELGERSP